MCSSWSSRTPGCSTFRGSGPSTTAWRRATPTGRIASTSPISVGRRSRRSGKGGAVASISHEDALQLYDDAGGWLQTWYLVRYADRPLVGPPVGDVIPPIERSEFVEAVARDAERIVRRVDTDQRSGLVAYTLLTLCRVLRALDDGAITSKQNSASWVADRMPEARWVIDEALAVRASGGRRAFEPAAREPALALIKQLGADIRRALTEPHA